MEDAHAIAPLGYNTEHMEVRSPSACRVSNSISCRLDIEETKENIPTGIKQYVDKTIRTVVIDRYPDVYVHELNIQEDHVHALLEIPPKCSVAR